MKHRLVWIFTIAIIPLQTPDGSSVLNQKAARLLQTEIRKVTNTDVKIENPRYEESFPKEAWEDYFHLRLEAAKQRIKDREDLEALKLKAVIAFSEGELSQTKALLTRIASEYPEAALSAKEFPPGVRTLFEEAGKNNPRREAVLYYGIRRIGWNHELTAKLVFPGDPDWEREKKIEMVSLRDLPRAIKIVVQALFEIDSFRHFK